MWSLLQERCDPFRDPTYSEGYRTAIRCLGSRIWGRAGPRLIHATSCGFHARCRDCGPESLPGGRPQCRMAQADYDFVAVDADRVAAHAQARVDRAAAGGDVEVPLVPWAAHERVRGSKCGAAVAQLDRGCDPPAGAERCAAVRAAVGQRVELLAHAIEGDAVAAELDHSPLAVRGRLGERKAQLVAHRGAHAVTGAGSPKKRAALRWATPSRQSAGRRFSVWRGSS